MDKTISEYELPITISGLAALTTFTFKSENALAYKTLNHARNVKKRISSCNSSICMYRTHT